MKPITGAATVALVLTLTACSGGLSSDERHVCGKVEQQIRDTTVRSEVYAGSSVNQMIAYSSASRLVAVYVGELPAGSKIRKAGEHLHAAFDVAAGPPASSSGVVPAEVDFRQACGLPLNP